MAIELLATITKSWKFYQIHFYIMKKTYQQEQYNELHPRPKSRYEQFQEWLNECPVEIANYLDYTDTFEVTFKVPLEDSAEVITQEQIKSIKGNLL